MADPSRPQEADTPTRATRVPNPRARPATPAWVKLFGIAALVIVLLLVVAMFVGGGRHGPGRHGASPDAVEDAACHDEADARHDQRSLRAFELAMS